MEEGVSCIGDMRDSSSVLGRKQLGIPVDSWKDNIKVFLTSLGFWEWAGFNYCWSVILNIENLEVISSSAE